MDVMRCGCPGVTTHHRSQKMAAKLLLLSPPCLSRPRNTNNNQLIKTTSAAADIVVAGRRLHSSAASAIQEYYRPNTRRFCHRSHGRRRPWLLHPPPPACRALLPVRSSLHETLSSSVVPVALAAHHLGLQHPRSPPLMTILLFLADSIVGGGYSQASYYTSLGLFVISVPGLWSLIKRSVKSKIVQKTFIAVSDGEGNLMPNQVAGAILSFFARNNFVVLERGETITFEGMMVPSRSQAALLTFCTCISLASVALVLTITVPDAGNNWFWLTTLSPLAGAYYWTRASRKEQIKVKMIVAENGSLSEIIVQGDDQQVDRMRRELQLTEKGMIYVKGIFER